MVTAAWISDNWPLTSSASSGGFTASADRGVSEGCSESSAAMPPCLLQLVDLPHTVSELLSRHGEPEKEEADAVVGGAGGADASAVAFSDAEAVAAPRRKRCTIYFANEIRCRETHAFFLALADRVFSPFRQLSRKVVGAEVADSGVLIWEGRLRLDWSLNPSLPAVIALLHRAATEIKASTA